MQKGVWMKGANSIDTGKEIRALLYRWQTPLIQYAVRITGNLERARDVVQDTFLQLCSENLSSLNGHLEPWLFTVCRNRAFDVLRKEERMNAVSEIHAPEPHDDRVEPLEELDQAQRLSQVLKILETLPANQQEVIRLKFEGEMSYKEISQITGLSVGNVGFQIHAGLKAIRLQLSERSSLVLRRIK